MSAMSFVTHHAIKPFLLRCWHDLVDYIEHRKCAGVGCPNEGVIRTWLRDEDRGPVVRLCVGCYRGWKGPPS